MPPSEYRPDNACPQPQCRNVQWDRAERSVVLPHRLPIGLSVVQPFFAPTVPPKFRMLLPPQSVLSDVDRAKSVLSLRTSSCVPNRVAFADSVAAHNILRVSLQVYDIAFATEQLSPTASIWRAG